MIKRVGNIGLSVLFHARDVWIGVRITSLHSHHLLFQVGIGPISFGIERG